MLSNGFLCMTKIESRVKIKLLNKVFPIKMKICGKSLVNNFHAISVQNTSAAQCFTRPGKSNPFPCIETCMILIKRKLRTKYY